MNQRKWRGSSLLVAVTLISSLLAGCSKSAEESKPSGSTKIRILRPRGGR